MKKEIIKRFSEFEDFINLPKDKKDILINAFINGYFHKDGRKFWLRTKGEPLNLDKCTNEYLGLWYSGILETPFIIINF